MHMAFMLLSGHFNFNIVDETIHYKRLSNKYVRLMETSPNVTYHAYLDFSREIYLITRPHIKRAA